MPVITSAKKALRNSLRKRRFNLARRKAYVDLVKKCKKLVAINKIGEAKNLVSSIQQAIDKAAKTNLLSKNTAARKKSRLAKLFKRISVK